MTKSDILDAVNDRLLAKWPERTVYVDVCPVDFERPSFWLSVEKELVTPANRFLARHELTARLRLYDETDEHYEASWERLARETDEAAALLTPYLRVGGRAVTPTLEVLAREADHADVLIRAAWMEPAGDGDAEPAPAAETAHITVEARSAEGTIVWKGKENT